MEIRQLRYFVSVIEHGSFTRAAEAENLAQPALGLQIRKLEDELGVQLLIRHSRGTLPTPAGEVLVKRARKLLYELEATRTCLKDSTDAINGRITLGMTPSLTAILAPTLIRRVSAQYPDIKLILAEELNPVLVEWLNADRLDLGIGYGLQRSAAVEAESLLIEELYLIEPATGDSPIKKTNDISFDRLKDYPLMLPASPHSLRDKLGETSRDAGISLEVVYEINSVQLMKELVQDGFASTILPLGAVSREVQNGGLKASRIVDPLLTRNADLVYSGRRPRSNAEIAVCNLVKNVARELEQNGLFQMSVSGEQ